MEVPSFDDSSVQGRQRDAGGPLLLLRSDGNQSRQMSPTAGSVGCQTGLGWPGTSSLRPGPGPAQTEEEASMGPRREAVDLLEETVPTSPPTPTPRMKIHSLGVGVGGLLHPFWTVFPFVGNGHLNY